MERPWWQTGVFYQIYPRSFLDTDGDGVGDLEGVRRRLDHLAWLGVDAIWLSPIFRSPMVDFGYDVADYTDVDPLFGDLATFDALVEDAHERGMRIILDWVANHTSDQHPWFVESRVSRDSAKRDWYIWRDPAPDGGPPNNWVAHFPEGPAWTFDEATGQYYLHLFTPEQPDLNWSTPDVREAMHATLRFWLERGVDGFRADVVHLIGKEPSLPSDDPPFAGVPRAVHHDREITHDLIREVRHVVDGYDERMMVGEINLLDAARVARYARSGELHLAFYFGLLWAPWEARSWRDIIAYVQEAFDTHGAWPTWVLGNHDSPRQRTRYGGSAARARVAAMILLTLRGTPFLYAGEELGLRDADVPPERQVDPAGNRDGCRAPIPWDGTTTHGWATEQPWLPWPPETDERNAADLRDDETSILHLYRRLLELRRETPALHAGAMELLDTPEPVVAYRRESDGDVWTTVGNFGEDAVEFAVEGSPSIIVASDGAGEGESYAGTVDSEQALLLQRP